MPAVNLQFGVFPEFINGDGLTDSSYDSFFEDIDINVFFDVDAIPGSVKSISQYQCPVRNIPSCCQLGMQG